MEVPIWKHPVERDIDQTIQWQGAAGEKQNEDPGDSRKTAIGDK